MQIIKLRGHNFDILLVSEAESYNYKVEIYCYYSYAMIQFIDINFTRYFSSKHHLFNNRVMNNCLYVLEYRK